MDFKNSLLINLKKQLNLEIQLEKPPKEEFGDLSLPCFKIGNPQEIIKKINLPKYIKKAEIKGPYINFFFKKEMIAENIINQILKEKDKFGSKSTGKRKKILIEHTSINPNASPHLGRARNAILGDSIVRMLKFQNYKVETHYLVNDIGKQIAMLVLAAKGKNPSFNELLKLYINFNKKLEKNEGLEKEVFYLLNKVENNEKKTISQFKRIVNIAVKGQTKILKELDIKFDKFDYESSYLTKTNSLLNKLKEKNKLFTDQENREVVNLSGFNLPMEHPFMPLTRADKTTLYPLRDVAYTIDKLSKSEKSLLVLGEDQKLYFQQIRAILSILGYKSPDVIHYSFVLLKTGKMSTRQGNFVLLEDLMKEAKIKAINEIKKRHKSVKNPDKLAEIIAYGAIKYTLLKTSSEKNIIFDMEKALSFDAESAPYIQYTFARSNSILKKAKIIKKPDFKSLITKEEISLVNKLNEFHQIVAESSSSLKPHIIASYTLSLAQIFNEFYQTSPILTEKEPIRSTRLKIILAYKQVIRNALNVLGIETPEFM